MKKFCLLLLSATALFATQGQPVSDLEFQKYLQDFPFDHYTVAVVHGQGKFYLDPIQDCIKNFLRAGMVWEPHIVNLLRKHIKKGSTVVDIGAHIGTHTVVMAKFVGKQGKVVAIEPQPKHFRELYWNCKLNNVDDVVELHHCAVGGSERVVQIKPGPVGNEGHAEIANEGDNTGDYVRMRTVDSFHLRNVSLMKIDVENFEEEVLGGTRETILANRPVILIEILGGSWFVYETVSPELKLQIEHVKNILVNMRYHVTRIYGCDFLAIPTEKRR